MRDDTRRRSQMEDMARLAQMRALTTSAASLWHGERPRCAPAGTLYGPTGRTVSHDTYVLSVENFERAEQAIALCLAHGLLAPTRR